MSPIPADVTVQNKNTAPTNLFVSFCHLQSTLAYLSSATNATESSNRNVSEVCTARHYWHGCTKTLTMLPALYNITKPTTAVAGNALGVFEDLGDIYDQADLNLLFTTLT